MFRNHEYGVSVSDDWVNPEETLLDSSSEYSDLEVPISNNIFKWSFFITLFLFFSVFVFVFNLSIRKHDYFANIAFQNRSINFSVPPPRGIIFDRLGNPLVKNEPIFDLIVVSKEADDNDKIASDVERVADILEKNRGEFQKFVLDNLTSNSVFFAESGLNKNQVLEIKYLEPRGFYIIPNTKRRYIDGPQFSQVIGYIGKVNKEELSTDEYYYSTDTVGRLGIEARYEKYLRGEHGKIFFQNEKNDNLSQDSKIGNSLVLNIDYEIQKHLFNELFSVLNDTSFSRAAAIIQDPKTGSILAMTSFPAYDNNLFVSGLSDLQFKSLFHNKSRPLFNRVISGLYNPGSAIKPFMGLMALEENIFSPSDTIQNCTGLTVINPYNSEDSRTFNNWRLDYGPFNLKRATANSCNIYFFLAGGGSPPGNYSYGGIKGLGIETIGRYLKSALVTSKLGIDLPGEENGFVPTPEWKLSNRGENWYQGDTYNISIGQGDLLVTPLWLNSYISSIANGGTIYKPLVAKQILDSNKNVIKTFEPEILTQLNFKKEVINEVREAMAETVISGTARLLGTLPVKAAAKTGTAEVVKGRTINSIMTAFAPFDNPEISLTILIEGSATNEGLAIRTTYGFMKWYFGEYKSNLYF